jgi:hypothetical protein
MPPGKVDLSQGSVLHIKDFSSRGHPPKDKYLFVVGKCSESEVLGFLISTQLQYLKRDTHKREVISIPDKATAFLRCESIIQCFELERLNISALCDGFDQGRITNEGKLPAKYAHKIRDAVKESRLLPQIDIEAVLRILPAASPSK